MTATPVIIGVADIVNRSQKVEDAVEPLSLMLQAIQKALEDTSLPVAKSSQLQSQIDSIDVVATWTWVYPEPGLPSLLAKSLGVEPNYQEYSPHGGNNSVRLLDAAARRISQGRSKVAVVTGGEALASLVGCAAAKRMPPPGWTEQVAGTKGINPSDLSLLGENVGSVHSFGLATHIYPLFENGLRAHKGRSAEENHKESTALYADFAKTAAENPQAWSYGQTAKSEESIGTITKSNRMICYPYPLLMNAFNNVNMAAACLLTSTEYAQELGVPENHWIYPLGGAGTAVPYDFWERPNYHTSPSLSRSLDATLEVSGLRKEDIDLYDFYSCFPIVPKLACEHLGIPLIGDKPITLLGGLTSFGGAGNNYSLHSVTETVRQLRSGRGTNGLVLANGGTLTSHHAICLSSKPAAQPYIEANPLPDILAGLQVPPFAEHADGEARIETYTVEFDRAGKPLRGYVVGILTGNGHRFIANHGDDVTLEQLASSTREPIGRMCWVEASADGRNLVRFLRSGKL